MRFRGFCGTVRLSGQVIAESDSSGTITTGYIFSDGKHVAWRDSSSVLRRSSGEILLTS